MLKHLKIRVYGRVQGVYFRATANETAGKHGVRGFARNEKDGTVYIEAEGDEEKLVMFVEWCKIGPSRAKVEKVETEEGQMKNFDKWQTAYSL